MAWVIVTFENHWNNISKIFGAVWDDFKQSTRDGIIYIGASMESIVIMFQNTFKMLLKLAASAGKNLWDLLLGRRNFSDAMKEIGKDFDNGLKEMKDPTKYVNASILNGLANFGRNTERVMGEIGATPFPELQGPDYGALRDKYKNMGKRFAEIDKETEAKLKENDKRLKKMLSDKVDGGNSMGQAKEAEKRQTPVGSFSVALLAAMTGAQSPAERTAKATEHMERDIKKMRLGGKSFFYS